MKPKIVIVAGGLAIRMKSITKKIPKCMIDINGKPLIQHQIEFFKEKGYKDFIFCIRYLGEKIKEYFKDGSEFGVKIEYSEEELLAGTAGAVRLTRDMIDEVCIVMYGDILTKLDIDKALEFHKSKNSEFTVIVRKRPKGYKSSSLVNIKNDKVLSLVENPDFKLYEKDEGYINNGIYIMNKTIFKHIPNKRKYDFAKDLIPCLKDEEIGVYAYVSDEFFKELGRPEKYEKFKKEIEGKGSILG